MDLQSDVDDQWAEARSRTYFAPADDDRPLHLEYTLSRREYGRAQAAAYQRDLNVRLRPVALGLVALFCAAALLRATWLLVLGLVGFVCYVSFIATIWAGVQFTPWYRRRPEEILEVTVDGLELTRPEQRYLYTWDRVLELTEQPGLILFILEGERFLAVPAEAMTDEERARLQDLAERHILRRER